MSQMTFLVGRARSKPWIDLFEPAGLPAVASPLRLPDDMVEFYSQAGGMRVGESDAWTRVVSPVDVVPSNPVIVGAQIQADISSSWYIIAQTDNGDHVSIDLSPPRLGRCYDSHYEVHGVPGEEPVIATSFTDFLERLLDSKGRTYWTASDFEDLGDAYD